MLRCAVPRWSNCERRSEGHTCPHLTRMGHGELVGIGRFRRRLPHLPLNRFFPPFWGQRDGICYGHQQQPPPHSTTSAAAAAAAAESGTKTRQLAVGTKTGHIGGRETGILRKQQYPPPPLCPPPRRRGRESEGAGGGDAGFRLSSYFTKPPPLRRLSPSSDWNAQRRFCSVVWDSGGVGTGLWRLSFPLCTSPARRPKPGAWQQ